MNIFRGELLEENGKLIFCSNTIKIPLPQEWKPSVEKYVNGKIIFGVRPEDIGSERAESSGSSPVLHAKIEVMEPMG